MIAAGVGIFKKIYANGFNWFLARLIKEFRIPETTLGKKIQPISKTFFRLFSFFDVFFLNRYSNKDTYYLFYDLEVEPVTFNFCWALAIANMKRKQLGYSKLEVIIIPGPLLGLRHEMLDYDKIIDHDARQWRKYNMLLPISQLVNSCSGVTVCATREQATYIRKSAGKRSYPSDYTTLFPTVHLSKEGATSTEKDIFAFNATKAGLRYVNRWLNPKSQGRKVIAITLRNYNYMPNRNSNIDAWAQFAKKLDPNEFFVVVVPDTESCFEDNLGHLANFEIFLPACWNIELRSALYELAYLNLGINSGPFALCWLNQNCRYLMFKIVSENVPQTSEEACIRQGFLPGTTPKFAMPYQKWVWENDESDLIWSEFQKMCKIIDNNF